MLSLSRGEIALVAMIFALVWGTRVLPQLAEAIAVRLARGARARDRSGGGG